MSPTSCSQLSGSIAQLVEHCTGIAEVMGSNPVEAASDNELSLIRDKKQ